MSINDGLLNCTDGVPAFVLLGIMRTRNERRQLHEQNPRTHLGRAARAERISVLFDREARWWDVLRRWIFRNPGAVPLIVLTAVMDTASQQRGAAQFWRESATDWRRQAAGLPVCSVIGCGCGGTCEVAA